MCREAFLSSLFLWFVTPYMTPVQHTELCPYWLHSFVLVQFCFADQILCSFAPISRWLQFCTKLFFCACNCTFLQVLRTEGSMQHSECIVNICLCTWEEAVQLHRTHVHSIATLMWTNLCIILPSMCTPCSWHCDFCVHHCPGELSVKGTRSLNRFSY